MKKVTSHFFSAVFMLLSSQTFAQSYVYQQGYDYGFDAGVKYCKSIRLDRHVSQSDEFFAGCKVGFINAIDANINCANELRNSGRWSEMMDYRNSTCS